MTPTKEKSKGMRKRMAAAKRKATPKPECAETGLDSNSKPPSVSSSGIRTAVFRRKRRREKERED